MGGILLRKFLENRKISAGQKVSLSIILLFLRFQFSHFRLKAFFPKMNDDNQTDDYGGGDYYRSQKIFIFQI